MRRIPSCGLRLACCACAATVVCAPQSRAQRVFGSAFYAGVNAAGGPYTVETQQGAARYDPGRGGGLLGYAATVYQASEQPWALQSGMQIRWARSGVQSAAVVPGFAPRTSIYRQVAHQSIAVPLHIARRFALGRRRTFFAEPHAGASVGWCSVSMIKTGYHAESISNDSVGILVTGTDQFGGRGLVTADVGIILTPSRRHPKWQVGVDAVWHLTSTPALEAGGTIYNTSQGISEAFGTRFTRQYRHASVSLRYAFGKRWKQSVQPLRKRYGRPATDAMQRDD